MTIKHYSPDRPPVNLSISESKDFITWHGFYDPPTKTIYINQSKPRYRQLITLIHETIHYLISRTVRHTKTINTINLIFDCTIALIFFDSIWLVKWYLKYYREVDKL